MTSGRRLGKPLGVVATAPLSIALRCEDETAAPALLDAFGGLLETGHEATEQRTARREGNAFVVDAAGRSLEGRRCISTTSLIARLQTELKNAVATDACAAGRVVLHAGTLTLGDVTVLLVGTSGAGKTTLTAALVAEAAGSFSDEFVPLGPASRTFRGYPKPLTVKYGAQGLLSRFPQVGAVAALDDEEDPGVPHVPLPSSTLRREARGVGAPPRCRPRRGGGMAASR